MILCAKAFAENIEFYIDKINKDNVHITIINDNGSSSVVVPIKLWLETCKRIGKDTLINFKKDTKDE